MNKNLKELSWRCHCQSFHLSHLHNHWKISTYMTSNFDSNINQTLNLPFTQNSSEIAHDQMLRRTPHFTSMLKFVTANTPRYLTTFTKHVTFDQMIWQPFIFDFKGQLSTFKDFCDFLTSDVIVKLLLAILWFIN